MAMAEQLNAAAFVLPTGILQQDFDIIDEQENRRLEDQEFKGTRYRLARRPSMSN
jgi:hypothetical protein